MFDCWPAIQRSLDGGWEEANRSIMRFGQDKCPATARGRALAAIPPGLVGLGKRSLEKAQGTSRQQVKKGQQEGPAASCVNPQRAWGGQESPSSAQHSLDHIRVLHPVLGPCNTGKTMKNWSEFSRCH